MSDKELSEKKGATWGEYEVNEPVTPPGGDPEGKNRKADVNKDVDPNSDSVKDEVPQNSANNRQEPTAGTKSAPRKADKAATKESVEELFGGEELSEEFREKAAVIFETAVQERVAERMEGVEAQFDEKLTEQMSTAIEELTNKVNDYMTYAAESWMEKNELAVENGLKTEIAESLMNGLADLFTEHNIDLSDEKIDAFEEVQEEVEKLRESLDEQKRVNMALAEEVKTHKAGEIFDELAEGLADTQVEKFKSLTEGMDYDNLEDYRKKASIIRENWFAKPSAPKSDESEVLSEGNGEIVEERKSNSDIDAIVERMNRML